MAGPLFFIALIIIAAGGVPLLIQLLRILPCFRKNSRKRGAVPQIIRALGSGCVLLFGLFFLMLVLFARTYAAFTREEPIARIQCISVKGLDYDMVMRFVSLEQGREGSPELFRLNGDQWAVGGHIVQWHPWLNLLGLHTGYRLTRIEGRYLNAEDEATGSQTVYDLGDPTRQRIWHWLYRHHESIPLVRAAYGNTTYTFPAKDQAFVVKVTRSGFMVAHWPSGFEK
jgi:hypothetical protein